MSAGNDLSNSAASLREELGLARAERAKRGLVTGLVVQGGGMRGTYSMGALMALEEAGFSDSFDHVVGSSAGAINGAYFLANQARMAVTVYLDDISNKKFVNFFRLSRIVDIDYLIDGVLKRHKVLDVAKVRNSPTPLTMVMTDFDTGKSAELSSKDANFDLMEALRGTAALPILYNKPVTIAGRRYVDGGVVDSVPLFRAIALGCNRIVVVLTRPPGFRREVPSLLMRLVQAPFVRNYPAGMRNALVAEDTLFNRTMEALDEGAVEGRNIRLTVVCPSDMTRMVSRTTSDRSTLLSCAQMGRNDMRLALGLGAERDIVF